MKSVGINGFGGRIGKFTAYELARLGVPIGAVNDALPYDKLIKNLLNADYDYPLSWDIQPVADKRHVSINGVVVPVYNQKDPSLIEWGEGIYAIAECTGIFRERSAAEKHFAKAPNLRTVAISAPGKGEMKTLVMGINQGEYQAGDRVVSNASCTTKALAMPIKALMDYGIEINSILMDTVHAATNTDRALEVANRFVITETGAAAATGKIFPSIDGKMNGHAIRGLVANGSFANVYLSAVGENLSVESINRILENAVNNPAYCGRIKVVNGEGDFASSEIVNREDLHTASAVIVLSQTKCFLEERLRHIDYPDRRVHQVGIVSGYDNERAPSRDLAMLMQHILSQQ